MPEAEPHPSEDLVSEAVEASEEVTEGKSKKKKKKQEPERQDLTTLHERAIATLSYIGPFAIIPFYLKKDSEFCRFHGKQGMFVAIFFFIASILSVIDLVDDAFKILQAIIFFWMGYAALSGRWKRMPFIYKWSCALEESIKLKTKEEEEQSLRPNQVIVEQVQPPQNSSHPNNQ